MSHLKLFVFDTKRRENKIIMISVFFTPGDRKRYTSEPFVVDVTVTITKIESTLSYHARVHTMLNTK